MQAPPAQTLNASSCGPSDLVRLDRREHASTGQNWRAAASSNAADPRAQKQTTQCSSPDMSKFDLDLTMHTFEKRHQQQERYQLQRYERSDGYQDQADAVKSLGQRLPQSRQQLSRSEGPDAIEGSHWQKAPPATASQAWGLMRQPNLRPYGAASGQAGSQTQYGQLGALTTKQRLFGKSALQMHARLGKNQQSMKTIGTVDARELLPKRKQGNSFRHQSIHISGEGGQEGTMTIEMPAFEIPMKLDQNQSACDYGLTPNVQWQQWQSTDQPKQLRSNAAISKSLNSRIALSPGQGPYENIGTSEKEVDAPGHSFQNSKLRTSFNQEQIEANKSISVRGKQALTGQNSQGTLSQMPLKVGTESLAAEKILRCLMPNGFNGKGGAAQAKMDRNDSQRSKDTAFKTESRARSRLQSRESGPYGQLERRRPQTKGTDGYSGNFRSLGQRTITSNSKNGQASSSVDGGVNYDLTRSYVGLPDYKNKASLTQKMSTPNLYQGISGKEPQTHPVGSPDKYQPPVEPQQAPPNVGVYLDIDQSTSQKAASAGTGIMNNSTINTTIPARPAEPQGQPILTTINSNAQPYASNATSIMSQPFTNFHDNGTRQRHAMSSSQLYKHAQNLKQVVRDYRSKAKGREPFQKLSIYNQREISSKVFDMKDKNGKKYPRAQPYQVGFIIEKVAAERMKANAAKQAFEQRMNACQAMELQKVSEEELEHFWNKEDRKQVKPVIQESPPPEVVHVETKILKDSEQLLIADRFERVFGKLDKESIEEALEQRDEDDLREFIEEHYQAAIKQSIDEFLQLDFEEYTRRMAQGEEPDRMDHEWNLQLSRFQFKFATKAVLNDNSDESMEGLEAIGAATDDLVDGTKPQADTSCCPDLQNENVFIKELCHQLDISQEQLVSLFTGKLLEVQQDNLHEILGKMRLNIKFQKESGDQVVNDLDDLIGPIEAYQVLSLQALKPYWQVKAYETKVAAGGGGGRGPAAGAARQPIGPGESKGDRGGKVKFLDLGDRRPERTRSQELEGPKFNSEMEELDYQLKQQIPTFREALVRKVKSVEQAIEDDKRREANLKDPTKAEDVVDVIDQNLEQILASSEIYKHVEEGTRRAKQMAEIKEKAKEMLSNLKDKAAEARQSKLQDIQRAKGRSILQQLAGNKIDYLVSKFIAKLKARVQESKDKVLIAANEKVIGQIMKKQAFNRNCRTAEAYAPASLKLYLPAKPNTKEGVADALNASLGGLLKKSAQDLKIQGNRKNLDKGIDALQGMILKQQDPKERGPENTSFKAGPTSFVPEASIAANQAKAGLLSKLAGSMKVQIKNEFQKYQKKLVSDDIVKKFISNSIESGSQPLPILNRIDDKLALYLMGYTFNAGNAASLAGSMELLVPSQLRKLVLVENSLGDKSIARIFQQLQANQAGGLTQIAIVMNDFGKSSLEALQQFLDKAPGARSLKGLHIKNPTPSQSGSLPFGTAFTSMAENADRLVKLQKLTVSQFRFSPGGIEALARAVTSLYGLHDLDLSSNRLKGAELTTLITLIHKRNHLRSLNIAFNSASNTGKLEGANDPLAQAISDFIHFSDTLLHINLDGMSFPFESSLYIAERGLRKSRTLLSCHFAGQGLREAQSARMAEVLKIKRRDPFALKRFDNEIFKAIFRKDKRTQSDSDAFAGGVQKQNRRLKNQAKQSIQAPPFRFEEQDRVVYERVLGHSEIIQSHHWTASSERCCQVCNQMGYCIFVWNQLIQDSPKGKEFYSLSANEPIQLKEDFELGHPVLYVNGQMHRMVPATEFIERLQASEACLSLKQRACNNEKEADLYELLKREIHHEVVRAKSLHPTFWKEAQALLSESQEESQPNSPGLRKQNKSSQVQALALTKDKLFGPGGVYKEWDKQILELIPKGSFQAVNMEQYAKHILELYQGKYIKGQEFGDWTDRRRAELKLQEKIGEETFVAATFLPCQQHAMRTASVSGNQVEAVIKHPGQIGVNYLGIPDIRRTPMNKHLSVSKGSVHYKQIKKIKQIRKFWRPNSVFAGFVEDTSKLLDKGFELDRQYMKIPKFIKDPEEANDVMHVLRKYFPQLKDQFCSQIANPKFYPVIGWLDYGNACTQWQIVDKNLTSTDIDRTFIAVNFEEVDLDANDDKSLCRYEFLEITARLAKIKYYDKGRCDTIAEATERLITEYMLPNTCEVMPWQPFRDEQLWNLEIDELFKANAAGIQAVYNNYKSTGEVHGQFQLDDAVLLVEALGYSGVQYVEKASYSYALSKAFIADEMEQFELYQDLKKWEFHEFIGRLAYFLFPAEQYGESYPLVKKIESLLQLMFAKAIAPPMKFNAPDNDANIESDSDYDDDWVEEIVEEALISQAEETAP